MPDFQIEAKRAYIDAVTRYASAKLRINLEGVEIGKLIDAVGEDAILDAIGQDAVVKHFGLKLAEE
jgi:hypothetical protein